MTADVNQRIGDAAERPQRTVANALPFFGASCGIEIRVENVEGTEAARELPRVQFQQAKPADVFRFLVNASGLEYTVLDEKTIVVTK